ncbi:MAG: hypothetical protein CR979_00545 [Propionibacterium sp.]|nr:MAG: hypothetical protein CR979_00545 [Propionibacterium sp.]
MAVSVSQLWRNEKYLPWSYLGVAAVLGIASGIFWATIVQLPTFTLNEHLQAVPYPERELANWFSIDFWFAVIGIALGLLLGTLSWFWFQDQGWLVVVMALAAVLFSAVLCLQVGTLISPGSFELRVTQAQVGDKIPISFELRSWSTFFLWCLSAITPVMVLSFISRKKRIKT